MIESYRLALLVAGIVATVGLPTTEFETNVTEVELFEGRRVLSPAPAPAPPAPAPPAPPSDPPVSAPVEEDCPNIMWKMNSKKDSVLCTLGQAQEWGMVACFVLNFFLAIYAYNWLPAILVGPKFMLSYLGVCAIDTTQLRWCTRDYLRLFIALFGPLIFELDLIYIFFEVVYGNMRGFGKSEPEKTDTERVSVTNTPPGAKFNQGFPKIGPGDCRNSKYARVQTNAC